MNRLEEIQEIIKNFIYEKQQMKQEITEIESRRNKIAQDRNRIKFVNEKADEVFAQNAKADIAELGRKIAELGNQSQELQNKLSSRYIEVKKQVNIRIDNLISEGIREIRKIEEQKKEIEEGIALYEERQAKYEIQKQEFLARFGRLPELSGNAQKEIELQEQECQNNEKAIVELEERVEKKEIELSELAKYKRAFKNANWNVLIKEEKEETVLETPEENVVINEIIPEIEEIVEEDDSENGIDALLNAVEEVISPLDVVESVNEEVNNDIDDNEVNVEAIKESEEESITLPLMDDSIGQLEVENIMAETQKMAEETLAEEIKIENIEPLEEVEIENIEPLEEVEIEYIEPLGEINIEEIQPIEEIVLEEVNPIQEVKIEEIESPEEIKLEEIQPIEEINAEEPAIQNIEVEKTTNEDAKESIVQNIETEEIEEEVITYEESAQQTQQLPTFDGKVVLTNIIAKFEEKELVYKAQLNNGKEITIYPKTKTENLILKYKENIEEIKEILINYAVAEYRTLDKKVIKKIDPIICEVLTVFAKQYNYDTQNLIYNYAMSFSKYDEYETETIPNITYNISYMEGMNLTKKEKEVLSKICKNAKKNEKIDIVGCNTGFSKIRYILKRTFNANNTNALPEGKY